MKNGLARMLGFQGLLVLLLATAACDKNNNGPPTQQSPPPFGPGGPNVGGRPQSPVGKAMSKLFKGRPSLSDQIGSELKQDSPPWDTLQPRTKEFAELARSVSKETPPRGSKESWDKLTASFGESATKLEQAVNAKDKDTAMKTHELLRQSCKACHDVHKGGPGGFPPRGGPGRFPPPGGPQQ